MSLSNSWNSLRSLAISENGFVFDPRTGHAYTANQTGLAVLRALKEGRPVAEITRELSQDFPGVPSIEADVCGFLRLLSQLGIVEVPEQEAP